MSGVSLRTLILMLELLAAVVAWQHFTPAEPVQAQVLWLAADCHTAATMRLHAPASIATAPVCDTAGKDAEKP